MNPPQGDISTMIDRVHVTRRLSRVFFLCFPPPFCVKFDRKKVMNENISDLTSIIVVPKETLFKNKIKSHQVTITQ